jgi:uncharacterized repeat protein (TIGR03806 family)
MKKNYKLLTVVILLISFGIACTNLELEEEYVPISPVTVDLTLVPYPVLSDYHFFEGDLKDQIPTLNVLPFKPASNLFADYAKKKRFVWMPPGLKATYNGDGNALELPVGAALIKTFYYDNVQNVSPVGATRIVETRIMIRKATGWIFANYVWNAAQTEAYYDIAGSVTPITWIDENNVQKVVNYRIPAEEQCIVCHKKHVVINNVEQTVFVPIGIKPQNLNFGYTYSTTSRNQLSKWIEQGYLEDNFTFPTVANSTINYEDTSKPLELRARSYVDINCSHCHSDGRHCDYRPMRFAFSETNNNQTNMGVCLNTEDMQDFPPALSKIVSPANINRSMMFYRINTTDEAIRMPLHGRTLIHEEGVLLIQQWINSLTNSCN